MSGPPVGVTELMHTALIAVHAFARPENWNDPENPEQAEAWTLVDAAMLAYKQWHDGERIAAALNAQAGVVAWRYKVGGEWHASSRPPTAVAMWNDIEEVVPLYAAPQPQAEPVGAAVPDSHRVRLERMRREFSLTTFERARFWADECRMIVEALLAMAQQQPSPQASAEDVVAWAQRLDDGYDSAESPAYVEFYRRDVVESVIREMRASLGVGRE